MSRYRLAILVLVSASIALLSGCRSTNNCGCCCECEPQRQGLLSRLGFNGFGGSKCCGGTSCSSRGVPSYAEPYQGMITTPPPAAGGPIPGTYDGPILPSTDAPPAGTYPGPFPPPTGTLPAPSPVPGGTGPYAPPTPAPPNGTDVSRGRAK
jgi:hypothetical protein